MIEPQADTLVDGRYRLISRIGSGGMADVWCAEDQQLGRMVALKLLYRRFAEDAEFVERFRREASSAAGLQHPNVVSVYDRGEWDGTYYIAMEYLQGRSLKDVVRSEGPIDPLRAIDLTVQMLKAARFAHRRGVIHRDLKPQNVIVDDEGRVKVTDFGIARAGASDMTETGSIMGTAHYLSPEQAQGHAVSAASDLYAIGIVLYELLTGRVPFEGDSAVTIALKQVAQPPPPPSAYNPAVPPDLEAVVSRALEKDPARRFGDADEFIAALEAARERIAAGVSGQDTAAFGVVPPPAPETVAEAPLAFEYPVDPYPPEPERRRLWPWVAALGLLLALGGLLAFLLTRPEQVRVPTVVGQEVRTALTILENQGFDVRQISRHDPTIPADTVLRQDPSPGEEVDKGSTVTITVSTGPGEATVPDVQNLTQEKAQRKLGRSGFKVKLKRQSSDAVAEGHAVGTSPPAGTITDRGSRVTLLVSTGPEQVTVPNVLGQDREDAESRLDALGLKVAVTKEDSQDQDPGTVLRQNPAGGSHVDKGSTVDLVVARQPERVELPDVVGDDERDAKRTLNDLGLNVEIVTEQVSSPDQDHVVLSQRPPAGRKVRRNSTVVIVVGRFNPDLNPEGAPGG